MVLSTKQFFPRFAILVTALFGTHFLLFRAFDSKIIVEFQRLIEIYEFIIILTLAHFFALQWLFKKWPKYAGFVFTGLSLLKMLISILFLFPYIFPSGEQSLAITLNFMGVYFALLIFEVIFIAKSMGKNH